MSIDDMSYPLKYPPGSYLFQLIGTVGSVSRSVPWTMTIKYPCPNPNFLLKANPFESVTYNLRDAGITIPWTIDDLVFSTTLGDCDTQTVSFFYNDEDQSPLNTKIFENTGSSFKINYTENVLAVGDYYLTYKVSYNSYEIFKV